MKNLNSKLFEKSFDLKNSNVYGGKGGATYIECSENTTTSACSDTRTTTQDDAGKVLGACTSYNCP